MKCVVCFDIGGTNVKYAAISIEKQIIDRNYFKTDIQNGDNVLNEMCRIIEDYSYRFEVIGVTISCPGFVNTKTGLIESGNIISGFNQLNIRDYFVEKFNVPVAVENDANCATIAEHTLGNGQGSENIVCVTLGTGVGGGIIINNKIYNGSHFMAGEFGFMFINGIKDPELEDDILSNYASTRALIEETSKELGYDIDGVELFNQAKNGNPICQKNIELFYDYLAMAIYNICYILNPDKVLIGGAISQQQRLIEKLKDRLSQLKLRFSRDLTEYIQIEKCKYLNDAGLMGSYCNFINQYN